MVRSATEPPRSPYPGDLFYDTVLCAIRVWDGNAWITIQEWDKPPERAVVDEKIREIILATPEDRWRDIE